MPIFIVFIYLISVYVCMCMRVHVCHDTYVEDRAAYWSQGSCSTMRVPGIKIRPSQLVASTFSSWAFLLTHTEYVPIWKGRKLTQRASESEVFAVSWENWALGPWLCSTWLVPVRVVFLWRKTGRCNSI